MKKFLFTIICTLFPILASAQEPYAVLSDDNTVLTFYYDNEKEARGGMDVGPFTESSQRGWDEYRGNIKSVVFDESFANCTTITSTSYWFYCNNIGYSSLTTITGLENLKTDNVTDMSGMFDGCYRLTSLDVSGFNTQNVTDLGSMFSGCSSLTSLDVSGFNTSNVTNMSGMFHGCSGLTSLDLSGFNTSNVTNMSGMFHGCSGLTSLDLSGFNTQNVTNMSYMFEECIILRTIFVGNEWSVADAESDAMFNECIGLVGGAGTRYDINHNDKTYAHIDEGTTNPGYFTRSGDAPWTGPEPYAILSEDNTVVTFYYDDQKEARGGWYVGPFIRGEYNSIYPIYGRVWRDPSVERVVFDESFADCTTITSTGYWFYDCSQLTTITGLNYLNTNNVTDMSGMFHGCSGMTSLDLSSFDTSNVTNMEGMFANCRALTSLDLSSFDTSNVTNMEGMFEDCRTLTSLDLSSFDTSNVTNMEGMFADLRKGALSLDLSSFNTSNVTNMHFMFGDSESLTSINLSSFDTSNVTDMSGMFHGCSGLTSLDLSSFDTSNVTDMSDMFRRDSLLTTIYVGKGWTTENVSSEDSVIFRGCVSLVGGAGTKYDENHIDYTYAHIDEGESNPGYFTRSGDEPSYKEEPYAVLSDGNTVLTFYYDDQKEARGGMDVGPFEDYTERGWNEQSDNIEQVVFNKSFANCTTITSTSYWFFHFYNLTTITGLENLNTNNITAMASMFKNCSSLTSLDLSTFNTENVTDLSRLFHDCTGLVSIDLSSFNTSNVTLINGMFDGCESLESIDVSRFDTSKAKDMSAMFWGCSSLTSLDVSGFNTQNVTDMGEMFGSCSGLVSLDLSSFNTANVSSMKNMFRKCSSLTTIYVGEEWSTENIIQDYGNGLFRECTALVGGAGTTYDENHVDYTYAHVDEGESNPGYFTLSRSGGEIEPYAILIDDGTALEFRYDDMKSAYRDAMDIGPFTEAIQRGWESSAEGIKSVVFNESFANCTTITSTAYWFAGLSNLETFVGLEYLNTSNVTNMYMMFYNCTSLASLDLSYFNTQNVTDMSVMFGSCNALTTITVGSDWTTDHVEESDAMFESCFNLVGGNGTTFSQMNTDASYAHIDTEGYPGYFTASSSVVELYWEELNYAIEHGSEVLVQARESGKVDQWLLEELEMTLENANEMYNKHEADEEEVRNMTEELNDRIYQVEEAMKGGGEASEETWEKLQSTIDYGSEILSQARESSKVDQWLIEELEMTLDNAHEMEKEHTASEEEVLNMTEDLEWRIHEVEEAMKGGGEEEPYAVLSEDNTILTFYYDNEKEARGGMDVGPFEDGGRTAGPGWSEFNEQITTVVFDESFANCTTLTSTAYWFYGCENLTTITDFNNLKTDNVTDINAMFSDCHSLTSIDFSSLNLSNVTNMSQVFEDCRTLESVNFRGVNTENVTNMSDLFLNCHNLRTIDLSSFNTRNVTNMSHMFCRCDSLTTIYVGEGWNTENVTESDQMFERSANLVGGLGTTYDENHIGIEYAHIDGGVNNPGYLTGTGEREAYFDGLTAWVYGDATLNDAFAAVGREAAVQTVAAIVWEANGELTSEQLEGITNPNLLVYVNEASKAPADVQNVIIDGVAEEIILTDATGNSNFYCPQPFTAKSISYSRDFSQTTELEVSRGWETIALPFDVQSISHESHGNLIPFGGEDNGYHFWLRQLSEQGLERATQIEANKPYLISMPNNTIYPSVYNQNGIVTFSSTDVTVPETNPQSDAYADVTLHAAFQQVEQGSDVYALNVGEARGEYPEGSVFEQNYRDIRPFQAYTTHRAGTRFIPLGSLGGKDGATGINELRVENGEKKENVWYSLDGRRLYVKPTKKGVYVKDGQKIVIK